MRNLKQLWRFAALLALLALSLSPVASTARAAPPARDCSGGNATILAPQNGATVSGIVQIEGTASLGGDFRNYKLEVAPVGTESWGNIGDSAQQVVNGQLGVWDSAAVPDGSYLIRLRVVDPTGNYCEVIATNIKVQNSGPTATPTVENLVVDTPTPTEAPPIENAVPTPLPTVESPGGTPTPGGATATPTPAGPTRTPSGSGTLGGIDTSGLVEAGTDYAASIGRTFLFGVLTMGAIVFLIGVVFFVRRVL